MQNRLTIKDIARLSGVGKSTVSRVINNESGVNPDTRARILQVIEQHNFHPSKSARSLRSLSDKVVAIIVSRLDSPSENQAVRSMLPLFYQQGYDPIVLESQFNPARVEEHLQVLAQRNIDGVVLFGFTGLGSEMLTPWQDKLVMMARPMPGLSSVCYDDAGAVALLMDELIKRQLRHISFIGVTPEDTTTGKQRSDAYRAVCQAHKLLPSLALGDLGYQSGYDLLPQVLTPQTQAVICASDTITLGVQKYLQQVQPNAVQVCCIGTNPLLHFLYPATLFVSLGYSSSGEAAAKQLIAQLSGSGPHQQITLPARLISDPLVP